MEQAKLGADVDASGGTAEPPQGAAHPPMNRAEVARALGRSVSWVRECEGRLLHPRRDERGRWVFDPLHVSRLAERMREESRARVDPEGELAARVFDRLDQHADLRALVREFRASPAKIKALQRDWAHGFEDDDRRRRADEAREEREEREIDRARDRDVERWEKRREREAAEEARRARPAAPGAVFVRGDPFGIGPQRTPK